MTTPKLPYADTPTPSFHRPCWVEVYPSALRSNWRTLRGRVEKTVDMLAVVKANGYGLGLVTVSQVAIEEGAACLGVSSIEEGMLLREAGITTPILILGSLYPFDSFEFLFKHQLTPTIASVEAAAVLDAMAKENHRKLPVHLKVDSGFGRIGVSIPNAPSFIKQVAKKENLLIEGIYTHFASSDIDETYTLDQSRAFMQVIEEVGEAGVRPRWIHLANSSAVIKWPETHGTLVRPGLAYYGIPPYPRAQNVIALKPAFAWKSRVIFMKTVPEGSAISYARTWIAKRPTRVATLAVGYADGFPRILTNKGQVLVGGKRVPILGRVTMDMTMVDVTEVPECHVGDEAVLLGTQGAAEITATEMGEWAQTNAYEILCRIGARVPRVVHNG